ncbi:MAG: AAA family ATPase [Phycisphaerales bacterium]|nr:MAG: AAA family ATPase [Phycisphaerales bacterium]
MTGQEQDPAGAAASYDTADSERFALSNDQVRWRCDPSQLEFQTTEEVEPARGVVGQDAAVDALRFGLECYAQGQNVFIRGLTGTGRMTLVRQMLEQISPACPAAPDRCYVHNFAQSDRPMLISLPRGTARAFARRMDEAIEFISSDLARALSDEGTTSRRQAIERSAQQRVKAVIEPFEKELQEAGLALVKVQVGPVEQAAIFPVVAGKPVPPEEFQQLHAAGQVTDEQRRQVEENLETHRQRLEDISHEMMQVRLEVTESMTGFVKGQARTVLQRFTARLGTEFPQPQVSRFLEAMIDDVVENHLDKLASATEFVRRYRVNVLHDHVDEKSCPVVVEHTPTLSNLIGSVDRESGPDGRSISDHMMIHDGSLLRADGGYLIVEARDVLGEPGAWKVLMRTVRTGRLEIVPPELSLPWLGPSVKPEPIDLNVKVILIGDAEVYYLLDAMDPDFPQQFKVLADFDSVLPRDVPAIRHYASVLAKVAAEENLPPFDRSAVAALVEHGARIAARNGKLTARFSRVCDIAREAAFIATTDGRKLVTRDDVTATVRRTKFRANLPSRRFRELVADGTIRVQTTGRVVGQVNGLAVMSAGQLAYGFPARITATIGAGAAGAINIDREANLSGAIHTKGFYILSGLLRHLLQTDHPLAFTASIAFEQSYGGIDGDSASGAEICCLLSALTGVPLRQDVAMTGAIDQHGHILAVGAVNEKIEGFFDACSDLGLNGSQGVIIPASNAGDLVLREDVAEACREGRFRVYAVQTVNDALEILTGIPAGERDESGSYGEGTLLAMAVERAHVFWIKAALAANIAAEVAGEIGSDEDEDQ